MRLRLLPTLLLLLLPLARPVHAQPAEPPASAEDAPAAEPSAAEEEEEEVPADALPPELPAPGTAPQAAPPKPKAGPLRPAPLVAPAVPARRPVRPLLTPTLTDAQLEQAFAAWRRAVADGKAAGEAQAALLALRQDFDIASLDGMATAFVRTAAHRRAGGDAAGAVGLAEAAVALAPDLPEAHLELARAAFAADAAAPGRALAEVGRAVAAAWRRPDTARAATANLGAALLLALVATAAVCAAVLFLRRARLFFHALQHLFPRQASPWHARLFGAVLLSLPLVLRLGLLTALFVPLLAVALGLTRRERAVGALLLVLVGLVPWAGGALVERTAFVGTPAEPLAALEGGGLGAEAAAAQVEARRQEGRAGFAELYALGRFQTRRGRNREAEQTLEAAAALLPGDARLLTALGNAQFAGGNLEGAAQLYEDAARADAQLAAPLYNLAVLRQRRAERLEQAESIREQSLAQEALHKALAVEPALAERPAAPPERELATRVLVSPPLAPQHLALLAAAPEAAQRVAEQLALGLAATADPAAAAALGAGGALLLLCLGLAGGPLRAARACERCGGAACRRCDSGLPAASALCAPCVAAFVRKDAVSPHVRMRKQLEAERARELEHRVASVLALLVSGAGHLFLGRPVRGALYTFLFLSALGGLLLHQGLVRVPFGTPAAALLALAPLAPVLVAVHLLSVRAVLKRRAQD